MHLQRWLRLKLVLRETDGALATYLQVVLREEHIVLLRQQLLVALRLALSLPLARLLRRASSELFKTLDSAG